MGIDIFQVMHTTHVEWVSFDFLHWQHGKLLLTMSKITGLQKELNLEEEKIAYKSTEA